MQAVNKTLKEYNDAKATYDDWALRQYKQNKGMVFLGGDDVFGEDPTINELEQYSAALFGMESALFCPSGTMTNQIAIRCHTQPGDEVICDALSHVYLYEGGGIASNSGASVQLLPGNFGRRVRVYGCQV